MSSSLEMPERTTVCEGSRIRMTDDHPVLRTTQGKVRKPPSGNKTDDLNASSLAQPQSGQVSKVRALMKPEAKTG